MADIYTPPPTHVLLYILYAKTAFRGIIQFDNIISNSIGNPFFVASQYNNDIIMISTPFRQVLAPKSALLIITRHSTNTDFVGVYCKYLRCGLTNNTDRRWIWGTTEAPSHGCGWMRLIIIQSAISGSHTCGPVDAIG